MEETLYWLFSTLAQTLAGAMALLSAFVLYRNQVFQKLTAPIEANIDGNLQENKHRKKVLPLIECMRLDLVYQYYKDNELGGKLIERLGVLVRQRQGVMKAFWVSLAATSVTLLGSFLVLALPAWISVAAYGATVLPVGLIAAAICLVSYIVVIVMALKLPTAPQ